MEPTLSSEPGAAGQSSARNADDLLHADAFEARLRGDPRCLDDMTDEDVGLNMLEPRHRGRSLSAKPVSANRLRWLGGIISLVMTQGCKFNCSYCPIPALNQKSWRFRSPDNIARQMRSLHE